MVSGKQHASDTKNGLYKHKPNYPKMEPGLIFVFCLNMMLVGLRQDLR